MLHFQKRDVLFDRIVAMLIEPGLSTASIALTASFANHERGHDHGGDHVHGGAATAGPSEGCCEPRLEQQGPSGGERSATDFRARLQRVPSFSRKKSTCTFSRAKLSLGSATMCVPLSAITSARLPAR